jgi:hypothetical protein
MRILVMPFGKIFGTLNSAFIGQLDQPASFDGTRFMVPNRFDRDSKRSIYRNLNGLIRSNGMPIEMTIELDHAVLSPKCSDRFA